MAANRPGEKKIAMTPNSKPMGASGKRQVDKAVREVGRERAMKFSLPRRARPRQET